MAITKIRIHPAVGIARVGNSPDEFFIGPEKPWDRMPPPGGYKDSKCRIKRQAARFRLWAYDENDDPVQEITAADATITWTVELANTKPASKIYSAGYQSDALRNSSITGADRDGLKITPGARTLNGPSQQAKFDNGVFHLPGEASITVPLGEVRSDNDCRLIVLGGFGKSGHVDGGTSLAFDNNDRWYDDTSDGPVTATVTLNGEANPTPVEGARVIVGPPNYAPPVDNIITMYDFLYDVFVQQGRLIPPNKPSFTEHIYPILKSTKKIAAVYNTYSAHSSITYPVPSGSPRVNIFNRLQNPISAIDDMPILNDNPLRETTLTPTQYTWMEKWKDDNGSDSHILNDWAGPPTPPAEINPEGLDKAALENACGGGFYPGMEAGEFLMEDASVSVANSIYKEPFRLDNTKVNPGEVTERMALPWQADFNACGTGWWPAVRPNMVIPQGEGYQAWDRDIGGNYDMTLKWHTAGFVVDQGGEFIETEKCPSTYITLLTPSLNFKDIPEGPSGMPRSQAMAIQFEVLSPGGPVDFVFVSGPSDPSLTPLESPPFSIGPTTDTAPEKLRIWIKYTTQAVGHSVSDSITIRREPDTGEAWTINISANTVARKKAAVALVLDRSGSMTQDRGDGEKKVDSLRLAADHFVELMLEEDALTLVRYNHDAQSMTPLTSLGLNDGLDPARTAARNKIWGSDLNPSGATSIGDGIDLGNSTLSSASGYDVASLVVLTDGKENTSQFIADIAASVSVNTYAVGFGTPENTSAAVLQTLSGNNGGYTLVTGEITGDNYFILRKYFLQILAGVSNSAIVTDPQGSLMPGASHRIPFNANEADTGMDVIVLTPYPELIDFCIETPMGNIIDPAVASGRPSIRFINAKGMAFYRLSLPQEFQPARPNKEGTWHAILSINSKKPPRDEKIHATHNVDVPDVHEPHSMPRTLAGGLPYSLIVHAYSDLRLSGALVQKSFEPGAQAALYANLSQYGVPISKKAHVWAEVTQPDGTVVNHNLKHTGEGTFRSSYDTSIPGTYRVRVRCRGRSRNGWPFYREFTQTIPVWKGGDTIPENLETGENGRPLCCCRRLLRKLIRFLKCLFGLR